MFLSLSESKVLCQRVFFALGFPAGADEDAAKAVTWSSLWGFSCLEQLHADIQLLRENVRSSLKVIEATTEAMRLDASLDSDYISPIEGVDLLCANASGNSRRGFSITVDGTCRPHNWLAVAVDRSRPENVFVVKIGSCVFATLNAELFANVPLIQARGCMPHSQLQIWCGHSNAHSHRKLIHEHALKKLPVPELSSGAINAIEVSESTWHYLKSIAKESFVPATEISRTRGAGPTTSDND